MIAYYVHHHGSGHLHRAQCIAARSRVPVLGLSSLPRPAGWDGPWHRLPADDLATQRAVDATAGGTLHWVPRRQGGVRQRAHAISAALSGADVRLFVSDVSVEAALLARLHGIPVVVVHQPGRRDDRPHRTAYDLADGILAALPGPGPEWWPASWHAKAHHVGAFSRFDHRAVRSDPHTRRVVVLWGRGGDPAAANGRLIEAALATPTWAWTVVGPTAGPSAPGPVNLTWAGWVDDPWSLLGEAEVVLTHAGQNALAEVAAARRPAVVIPEPRPFGEQSSTGRLLGAVGAALVQEGWPAAEAWPRLLDAVAARDGSTWRTWSNGDGAERATDWLATLWRAS